MARLTIGHIGLHVRDIEEEVEFLETLGGELIGIDPYPNGRLGFVSIDGDQHHNFALFEDGEKLASGDTRKENQSMHHIAMPTDSREAVDSWAKTLKGKGIEIDGPYEFNREGDGGPHSGDGYSIFFTDPNGICFEIYSDVLTLAQFREKQAEKEK